MIAVRVLLSVCGKRHGSPIVLGIDTKQMHADGILFYRSDNGVWLTDHIPARYILTITEP
jgi:putative RNA 2'-phosphotransferase